MSRRRPGGSARQRARRQVARDLEAALAAAGVTVSPRTLVRLARAYVVLREDLDALHAAGDAP